MSTIKQWYDDLTKVARTVKALNINAFKLVQVEQKTQYLNQAELRQKLEQFVSITGWIQETSKVHDLHQEKFQSNSIPLNGEWVCDGVSYHLDYVGKNQWCLQQYTLKFGINDTEATHLAEKITHRHVDAGVLEYQRLWQPEQCSLAPVARCAVFVGFKKGE